MTEVQTLEDRKYTKDHEWAKHQDGKVVIGITAFAVEQLGDITLVGLDVNLGDELRAGVTFGTLESVKTLSDLFAPLSGRVVAINDRLEAEPELINDDPWEKGWMVIIEPTNAAVEEASLMDAAAYRRHVQASDH